MSGIIQTLASESPIQYESVLDDFMKAAKEKNIDKMLSLTSPVTRKQAGDDNLRKLYAEEYVLMFKLLPNLSRGGSSTFVGSQDGGPGWIFKKQLSNDEGKSMAINVVVLKENGALYLSSLQAGP